jgi:SAM-dependent methyltransferase
MPAPERTTSAAGAGGDQPVTGPLNPAAAQAWQESWDRQMSVFQPQREEGLAALLDIVEATTTGNTRMPRLLDLGGGTGSVALRALRRWPHAQVTLLDLDPVLLAIGQATLEGRADVRSADLREPGWVNALPHQDYDVVLAVMALHYLAPARLRALYGEIARLLPGTLLINSDHMPDDGLPGLTEQLGRHAQRRRASQAATGAVVAWDAWWKHLSADPTMGPLASQRAALFGDQPSAEWSPPASWHLDALRAAGYSQVGLVWRHGAYAAVAGAPCDLI